MSTDEPRSRSQVRRLAVQRATDRPANTEPESLPPAEDAAQDVWRLRRVIADQITAARINGVGPWVAADLIAKALDRAGYTVAARSVVRDARETPPSSEPRDHHEANEATHGTPAQPGAAEGTETISEPRVHYEVEMYNDGWSIPIYRTHSVDDARAHEEPAVTSASTRIVRVTREVIQ